MKDAYIQAKGAKLVCLEEAGRDSDTTMFAIEKDEDYLAEFKTCVGQKLQQAVNERDDRVHDRMISYRIADDEVDNLTNKVLHMIKVEELKDHDWYRYGELYNEMRAKQE